MPTVTESGFDAAPPRQARPALVQRPSADVTPVRQGHVMVVGHLGMVGSAILRRLQGLEYQRITCAGRAQVDLTRQAEVERLMASARPDMVVLAAGKVGGIHANNTYPAEFIYENLMIEANVVHAAHRAGVQRLLCLGSSCIYPRKAPQPMSEEALLTGLLEPTNEPYAVAKIAGIKLCESYNRQYGRDYRSVMPTNLYGPNDNFHPDNSHVIPSLMRRFHEAVNTRADEVVIWGSGRPLREFLHVDDMAAASVHVLELDPAVYAGATTPSCSHVNVGSGIECSIRELAETMARVTGFQGRIHFDAARPDGTPRKLLDVGRLHSLGWQPAITLVDGLQDTYRWYRDNAEHLRR